MADRNDWEHALFSDARNRVVYSHNKTDDATIVINGTEYTIPNVVKLLLRELEEMSRAAERIGEQ